MVHMHVLYMHMYMYAQGSLLLIRPYYVSIVVLLKLYDTVVYLGTYYIVLLVVLARSIMVLTTIP